MNTREREVMDALAAQLRIAMNEMSGLPHSLGYEFTHIKKMDEAITAYDALLAEGSASSEGAQAFAQYIPEDQWSELLSPQPAQGEPAVRIEYRQTESDKQRGEAWEAVCGALDDASPGWRNRMDGFSPMDRACAAIRALSEHEPRSCEGSALGQCLSERRPIADEVVELSSSLEEDAALLRGLIDDGVPPADDLDRIADSMERASAFLKSALPRGLPVVPNGDDGHEHAHRLGVLVYGIDFGDEGMGYYVRLRDFKQVCERGLPAGSDAKEDSR